MKRLASWRRAVAAAAVLACLGLLGAACFPVTASAAYDPFRTPGNNLGPCAQTGTIGSPVCGANGSDPLGRQNGVINQVTGLLSIVAGIVSVIFLVWGGYKYITSNGDSSQIATAKQTVIYALVGLLVTALARPLINYVIGQI